MAEPIRTLIMVPSIDPLGPLGAGGAERMARNLCLEFNQQRVTPHLLTFHPAGTTGLELNQAGVKTHLLPKRSKLDPQLWSSLRSLIREEKLQVVMSMMQGTNLHNLIAAAGYQGTASIIRSAANHIAAKVALFEGPLSYRADFLVAPGQAAIDGLSRAYWIPRERCRVIPNGCQAERFQQVPYAERMAYRRKLGLPEDVLLVYTPNRVQYWKGQLVMAEALALLHSEDPDRKLKWLNTGETNNADYFRQVEEACASCKDWVDLRGSVANPEDYIAAADFVVVPSLSESFGNVFVETAFMGRPFVGPDCGVAPELLAGEEACLFTRGNAEQLKDCLRVMLERGEDERAAMGLRLAEKSRKKYSMRAVAELNADLIEEALERRRSRRA